MEIQEVKNALLKNGAKEVKGLTIKNVTVTAMSEYTRLGITLDKEVQCYVADSEGNYNLSATKIIFVSAFSIASLLKDNDDAAFAANHLVSHPEAMAMIMSRAKINILQQSVAAGEEYHNPFSNNEDNTTVFDHDVIINYITDITLSDFGMKRLEKLADMMLGF